MKYTCTKVLTTDNEASGIENLTARAKICPLIVLRAKCDFYWVTLAFFAQDKISCLCVMVNLTKGC